MDQRTLTRLREQAPGLHSFLLELLTPTELERYVDALPDDRMPADGAAPLSADEHRGGSRRTARPDGRS